VAANCTSLFGLLPLTKVLRSVVGTDSCVGTADSETRCEPGGEDGCGVRSSSKFPWASASPNFSRAQRMILSCSSGLKPPSAVVTVRTASRSSFVFAIECSVSQSVSRLVPAAPRLSRWVRLTNLRKSLRGAQVDAKSGHAGGWRGVNCSVIWKSGYITSEGEKQASRIIGGVLICVAPGFSPACAALKGGATAEIKTLPNYEW
jgi:hypothetical protein